MSLHAILRQVNFVEFEQMLMTKLGCQKCPGSGFTTTVKAAVGVSAGLIGGVIAGVVGAALLGIGGKKGYDVWSKQTVDISSAQTNPMYT